LNARDENSITLSNRIECIWFSENFAFNLMTCAIILAKAWFFVDKRHICNHLVDVPINTMKYLNGPLIGYIGPHMSPCILSRNFSGSVYILRGEGIKINFPVAQAVHIKSEILGNLIKLWHVQLPMIFHIIPTPGWPNLSC
jgi:hypothetical protein